MVMIQLSFSSCLLTPRLIDVLIAANDPIHQFMVAYPDRGLQGIGGDQLLQVGAYFHPVYSYGEIGGEIYECERNHDPEI